MRTVWRGPVAVLAASSALSLAQQTTGPAWISAGTTGVLPAQSEFPTPTGRVGLLLSGGPVEMKGHPFFTPLGKNGRACVTCHQPAYGMSVSADAARDLWKRTSGKGPLFAAVDGSKDLLPYSPARHLGRPIPTAVIARSVGRRHDSGGSPCLRWNSPETRKAVRIARAQPGLQYDPAAEPGIEAPPMRRPAGPSTRQPGAVPAAPPEPPARPAPPVVQREWNVLYDFDGAFLFSRDTRVVSQVAEYAPTESARPIMTRINGGV